MGVRIADHQSVSRHEQPHPCEGNAAGACYGSARNTPMTIIRETMAIDELRRMAAAGFGDMVKAVVDIGRGVVAVDAELHSDLEAALLDDGSTQKDLWGINLYPDAAADGYVEFDSVINLRPSQGNRSRGVEREDTRNAITALIGKRCPR